MWYESHPASPSNLGGNSQILRSTRSYYSGPAFTSTVSLFYAQLVPVVVVVVWPLAIRCERIMLSRRLQQKGAHDYSSWHTDWFWNFFASSFLDGLWYIPVARDQYRLLIQFVSADISVFSSSLRSISFTLFNGYGVEGQGVVQLLLLLLLMLLLVLLWNCELVELYGLLYVVCWWTTCIEISEKYQTATIISKQNTSTMGFKLPMVLTSTVLDPWEVLGSFVE